MSVTPEFIGQRYKDTNTGNIWIANSTTPGDWTQEVQNAKLTWTPNSFTPNELAVFYSRYGELEFLTDVVFLQSSMLGGVSIDSCPGIESIFAPNLISIDPTNTYWADFNVNNCNQIQSIRLPSLVAVGFTVSCYQLSSLTLMDISSLVTTERVDVYENASLTSLDLSSLVTSSQIRCELCPLLQQIDISSYVPASGDYILLNDCALTQTCVDHVLHQCVLSAGFVSGRVWMRFGTNSTPSAAGLIDKNTLSTRGVDVRIN